MRCRSVTSIETLMVPTMSPAPSRIGARWVSYVPSLDLGHVTVGLAGERAPRALRDGGHLGVEVEDRPADELGLRPQSVEPPTFDQGEDPRAVARGEDHGGVGDDLSQPILAAASGLAAPPPLA